MPFFKGRNESISPKKKKKIEIGFGALPKNKKKVKESLTQIQKKSFLKTHKNNKEKETFEEDNAYDKFLIHEDEEIEEKPKSTSEKTKNKKTLLTPDLNGKPVFLEDTGERLGIVYDIICDEKKHIIGYKIKDKKSETILSFTPDQFDHNKEGLIFIPSWYNKAIKTIEKLEFKDRISPELTTLLIDNTITNEELYDIFLKYDDEMATYMEEASALEERLTNHLKILEKQRLALKDNLMDLTEKRLINDIDRKVFSEDVLKHRRRVNILDVNITKCKNLLERLNQTSFGLMGKRFFLEKENNKSTSLFENHPTIQKENTKTYSSKHSTNKTEYKQKYDDLKEQFDQLEDEYTELKTAVEKLLIQKDDNV